jgi:hypothetical protein
METLQIETPGYEVMTVQFLSKEQTISCSNLEGDIYLTGSSVKVTWIVSPSTEYNGIEVTILFGWQPIRILERAPDVVTETLWLYSGSPAKWHILPWELKQEGDENKLTI